MKTEWGLRKFWRKTFQCITHYSSRRTFSKTSRACPQSWKNSCAYKQTCAYAIVGHQCHSRFHILPLKAEDSDWLWTSQTHTHIYTHRDEHDIIPCIHIFSLSLSLAHTLTHTQGLGTSRLVALTHFLCFEAASGEMAFPIIAFEACVRRRLCVYTWYGGREVLTLIHCNGIVISCFYFVKRLKHHAKSLSFAISNRINDSISPHILWFFSWCPCSKTVTFQNVLGMITNIIF